MADGARGRETGRDVVWILGRLEILGMAAETVRGSPLEPIIRMARGAIEMCVSSGQRESGKSAVIEFSRQPAVHAVARLAVGRHLSRLVIERGAGGGLEIGQVAGHTGCAEPDETSHGRAPVAGLAVDRRMSPKQREPVDMLLDRLQGYAPAANRMAGRAVSAKLPSMDIRVTVRTPGARLRKYQAGMACHAPHLFVKAPQRVGSLIVTEIRPGPDRLPACRRVAVFACNRQLAVWAARDSPLLWRCLGPAGSGNQADHEQQGRAA